MVIGAKATFLFFFIRYIFDFSNLSIERVIKTDSACDGTTRVSRLWRSLRFKSEVVQIYKTVTTYGSEVIQTSSSLRYLVQINPGLKGGSFAFLPPVIALMTSQENFKALLVSLLNMLSLS